MVIFVLVSMCFFYLFLFGAVWHIHNRVVPLGPDIPGTRYLVLYCCTTYYIPCTYLYMQSAAAAAAVAVLCVAILLLFLLQQPLLFVIVCRMVKTVAGSLNLIPSIVFFSFSNTFFFFMYVPLGSVVAFTALILPILYPR